MRANGKTQTFALQCSPGWSLRASLPRFQTAALSLTIVDENGARKANIVETPSHITGGYGPHKQYRLPKTYLDPFFICIESFSPGREVVVGLFSDRVAYCKPLTLLENRLQGYRCLGKTMDLANKYLDPVLGILGAPAQELSPADGSYTIVRYFTRPQEKVTRAGYLVIEENEKTYRRLFSCAISKEQKPEGRLFPQGLLALGKGTNDLPGLYVLTDEKLRHIEFPSGRLEKELSELSPIAITLTSFTRTKGALGPLFALNFYVESASGAHLLRLRIRKGEIVHSKVRELTPKERAILAPHHL